IKVTNFKMSQIVFIVNFLKEKKQTKKNIGLDKCFAKSNGLILANNVEVLLFKVRVFCLFCNP
uniref:Uncharacterized protein n=1 Tax=Prolemur simus TaxID=1328070 RepID=A0A8C9ANN8_PROSS